MSISEIIHQLNTKSGLKNPIQYFLNGGCYIFAKQLQNEVGGSIEYLTLEHHFVVILNNKIYDSSGNVTKKYLHSKRITETEFKSRKKLCSSIAQ